MRGKVNIVNTKADNIAAGLSRDKIIEMATITVRYDDAVYPDDYDQSLKKGDEGWVEEMWRFEEEIDHAALARFGVTL